MNVKIARVAIPGAASGKTIERRIRHSRRAVDAGRLEDLVGDRACRNWRMRKMPKTWIAAGAMSPK